MAGFTKKFVKKEHIITLKSHNNNFRSVVFTLLRCVYGCLWPACACVRVHIYIPSSLRLPYLVFSIRSYLPLDFNRLSSLRPTYHHPFGRPSTYSLFRRVSRLGTGSGTRCCGSTGGTAVHMEQKTRSKFLPWLG